MSNLGEDTMKDLLRNVSFGLAISLFLLQGCAVKRVPATPVYRPPLPESKKIVFLISSEPQGARVYESDEDNNVGNYLGQTPLRLTEWDWSVRPYYFSYNSTRYKYKVDFGDDLNIRSESKRVYRGQKIVGKEHAIPIVSSLTGIGSSNVYEEVYEDERTYYVDEVKKSFHIKMDGYKGVVVSKILIKESTTHETPSFDWMARKLYANPVLRLGAVLEKETSMMQIQEQKVIYGIKKKATIKIVSDPDGAEVLVDDMFVGNTPTDLSIDEGEYKITIKSDGYADYERKVKILGGSSMTIKAKMEH